MKTVLDTGALELILFGSPRVLRAGQVVTGFVSRKTQALFYYLAVTGQVHQRAWLASMFWPEVEDARALKNLRDVLPNLHHLLGPCLRVTRQTLAFDTSQPYWLDVAEVNRLAQRQNESLPLEAQIELTDLYRGEFLEGFYVDDAPEFESWLTLQREHLRELIVGTLSAAADTCIQQRTVAAGLAMTGRLLTLEPWREQAHRQRMVLLVMAGRREAALAQYQQCRSILRQELDVTPSSRTTQLYGQIRSGVFDEAASAAPGGEPASHSADPQAPHNLPRSLTPFIGRDEELADVVERLTNAAYPLVTLVGMGGVGKTRLSLAAAAQALPHFPDGVWFVPLAGIAAISETPNETLQLRVAAAIAAALSIPATGSDPVAALTAYLKNRTTLLVLDNFEHLTRAAALIVRLLESAAHLHILVTSRQRLQLMSELVYPVKGLPVPPASAPAAAWEIRRLLARYSSLQLFLERSRRADYDFELNNDNLSPVIRICQLLDGLPLGIELAAALATTQGCAELADALQENLASLASTMVDLPGRHQNVEALIDHSWQLLDDPEREVLAQSSVFYHSIRADAALAVLDTPIDRLDNLVGQSLLAAAEPGYYTIHEVVRQYTATRLAAMPELEHVTRQRHSTWFLDFVLAREAWLGNDLDAAREVQPELGNIHAAWTWAVVQGDVPTLERTALAYAAGYKALGLHADGAISFRVAVARLQGLLAEEISPSPDVQHTLGKLLLELSYFDERLGRAAEANAAVQQALTIGEHLADDYLLAGGYARMGSLLWMQGRAHDMVHAATRAIEIAQRANLGQFEAIALAGLGIAHQQLGDLAAAMAAFERGAALASALGRRRMAAVVTLNLAECHMALGNFHRAETIYQDVLRIRQAVGDHIGEGITRLSLGTTAHALGNLAAARLQLDRALRILHEAADLQYECQALTHLALLWHHTGDHETALAYGHQSVEMAQKIDYRMHLSRTYTNLGYALYALGHLGEAQRAFEQAIQALEETNFYTATILAPAGLAHVWLAQGNLNTAVSQVESVLPPMFATSLHWTEHPMLAFLACHDVLQAARDPRADAVLDQAHAHLQQVAVSLPDQAARTMFLHNLPAHRQILWRVTRHRRPAAGAEKSFDPGNLAG